MSSDNDRLMVKNKHVLKHLAKSGSENPKQKKKKKSIVAEVQSHLDKKASGVVFPYLVCQKITASTTASPKIPSSFCNPKAAWLLAVQELQATSSLAFGESRALAAPALLSRFLPPAIFLQRTRSTRRRDEPIPFPL